MITDKLSLAPLQGLTDVVFRNTYKKFFSGFDKAYTPYFATSEACRVRKSLLLKKLDDDRKGFELTPQLLSKRAPEIIAWGNIFYELGYEEINLNMGCPYPRVTKKQRGSGLLPDADFVERLLEDTLKELKPKLSIKVRLGLNESNEIFKLIPVFNKFDLSEVIIHPRLAEQLYEGNVDLNAFEEAMNLINHKIVYNGDIFTVNDFKRIKKQFPNIREWMIGRGALMNPFLPEQIKGLEIIDKGATKEKLHHFHNTLYEETCKRKRSPEHFPSIMKEYWSYLCHSFEKPEEIFDRIKRVNSKVEYKTIVEDVFKNQEITI